MACPYFYPVEAHAGSALLPLGDWWTGECRAASLSRNTGPAGCETACNLGYARGNCDWLPPGDGPDAVRFTISSHENQFVRIYYVIERDHHPFAHGALEYSTECADLLAPPANATLRRQALAYVESYLRRMKES